MSCAWSGKTRPLRGFRAFRQCVGRDRYASARPSREGREDPALGVAPVAGLRRRGHPPGSFPPDSGSSTRVVAGPGPARWPPPFHLSQRKPGRRGVVRPAYDEPWFQGKLPFSFDLPELQNIPFRLLGGRLAWLRQSPGRAQLLFEVGKHRISVSIFQDRAGLGRLASGFSLRTRPSFNSETWTEGRLWYLAVGGANALRYSRPR